MAASETLTLLLRAKDQATGTINKVGGAVGKLGKVSADAAKYGIGALTVGTTAAIGVMAKAASAANVQEQAELKLAQALKNTGQYSEEAMQALKGQAAALQGISTVGDETTIALQAMAVSMGFNADEATKVVKSALNMEKALGVDARTAIKGFGQTLEGTTGTLGRYLPQLQGLTEEQLKHGDAIDLVAKQYSGFLENEAKQFGGATDKMGNALGDLQEEFGYAVTKNEALLSATNTITDAIVQFTGKVSENSSTLQKWVNGGVAFAIKGFARFIGTIADGRYAFNLLKESIGDFLQTVAQKFALFLPDDLFDKMMQSGLELMTSAQEQRGEILETRNAVNQLVDELSLVADNLDNADGKARTLTETLKQVPESVSVVTANAGGQKPKQDAISPGNEAGDEMVAMYREQQAAAKATAKTFNEAMASGMLQFMTGGQFGDIVGSAMDLIIPGFGGAIGGVINMIANGSREQFDAMFASFTDGILSFVKNIPEFVKSLIYALPDLLVGILEATVNLFFETLANPKFWADLIIGLVESIIDAFKEAFKKIGKFFTDVLLGGIRKALDAFKKTKQRYEEQTGSSYWGDFAKELFSFGLAKTPIAFGRAEGGPVQAGMPYTVGENGPERFVPTQSGMIEPSSGGGNVNVTINANITNDNPREVVRQLQMAFRQAVSMGAITQSQNPFGVAYGG